MIPLSVSIQYWRVTDRQTRCDSNSSTMLRRTPGHWMLYCRHIRKIDQFHMRCLQQIAHIKWQDKIPNTEVLQRCQITGIEAFLLTAQLRWTRHVVRMDNSRLPRMIFYSQLQQGERSRGGQRKRYKDTLKANLTILDINPAHLESLTADRTSWRALCRQSIGSFEDSHISHAENKRRLRKTSRLATPAHPLLLQPSVMCADGLVAPGLDYFHAKEHTCDPSCRWLSPSLYSVHWYMYMFIPY